MGESCGGVSTQEAIETILGNPENRKVIEHFRKEGPERLRHEDIVQLIDFLALYGSTRLDDDAYHGLVKHESFFDKYSAILSVLRPRSYGEGHCGFGEE